MKAIIREHPLNYSDEDMYDIVEETMEAASIMTSLYEKCFYCYALKNEFGFTNEQLQHLEDVMQKYLVEDVVDNILDNYPMEDAKKHKDDIYYKTYNYLTNEYNLNLTSIYDDENEEEKEE
jgi:hypothetical protein